jgi:hypothetical protein
MRLTDFIIAKTYKIYLMIIRKKSIKLMDIFNKMNHLTLIVLKATKVIKIFKANVELIFIPSKQFFSYI